ncbi:MAG: SCO family protein [Chitinophagales bacterium]|nr:SCO family protein [Chitinophagales bacterium]
MKQNKILLSLLCLLLIFQSCKQKEKETTVDEHTLPSAATEVSDLSIYNLESTWKTQDNKSIQFKDLNGNVLVVVMIYTTCKSACPRLVADMKSLAAKVGTTNKPIQYILVSIDPKTDTPERFKQFAKDNDMTDSKWLFLTGDDASTREFANVVAMKYASISPIDFSHSNIISVFNAQGELEHQMEGLAVDNSETVAIIKSLAE